MPGHTLYPAWPVNCPQCQCLCCPVAATSAYVQLRTAFTSEALIGLGFQLTPRKDEHAFPASAQKPSACDGQHVKVVLCRDMWLQFLHVAVEKDKANWLTLCSFEEDGPHVLGQLS